MKVNGWIADVTPKIRKEKILGSVQNERLLSDALTHFSA
jgi:hypothetical protein